MRSFLIAGILLVAIGAVILLRGISFQSTHDVVKVGDVHVTSTESQGIPQWAGIACVVGGVLLVGAGVMKKG
jgi:drug/metabolite transporter (DMT)-like permease